MPSLAALLATFLLCATPVQVVARRCYYKDYPPTRPGHDLTGPTHTCTCRSNGRWGNCRRNSDMTRSSSSEDAGTIVDVAVANGFDTLVTAVKAADLAGALSGDGPFTVFAPTDAAFAALPDGVLDRLLDDTEALASVLLYHVVAGKVEADDVPRYLKAATLDGDDVELRNNGRKVTVNRVDVVAADVAASNGVIHVIDEVLIPPSLSLSSSEDSGRGTIVDVAVENNFDTLVAAVQAAGLVGALSGDGPLTVFAPTDAAFQALPDGIVDALLADTDTLTKVLLYHVVAGEVEADDIPQNLMAETLEGSEVELRNRGGTVTVDRRADVVLADVAASNGVVHVIDRVLIPDEVFDAVFSSCPR